MPAKLASAVRERPIIFSGESVRAILSGGKTQTRRVARFLPLDPGLNILASSLKLGHYNNHDRASGWVLYSQRCGCWNQVTANLHCPYGIPGERLWLKEVWQDYCPIWKGYWCGHGTTEGIETEHKPVFKADDPSLWVRNGGKPVKWRSPLFMPRWASRLTLEITDVHIQRLQDISEADAKAEGATPANAGQGEDGRIKTYRQGFVRLWQSINGEKHPWTSNPWVWALTFRRLDATH